MKGSQAAPGRFMITFDRPKNFDLAGGTGETQIEAELRKVGAQIMPPQNGKVRTSFVCEVPSGFPIGAVCRLVREGLDAERGTALVARLQDGKVFAWPIAETAEARKLPRWAAIVFEAGMPAPPVARPAAVKPPAKPPAPKATPVKTAPAAPAPVAAKPAPKAAAKPAPAPAAKAAPEKPKAPPPKVIAKPPVKPPAKPVAAKAKPAPKAAKPPAKKPAPPMRAAAKKVTKPAVKAKKR